MGLSFPSDFPFFCAPWFEDRQSGDEQVAGRIKATLRAIFANWRRSRSFGLRPRCEYAGYSPKRGRKRVLENFQFQRSLIRSPSKCSGGVVVGARIISSTTAARGKVKDFQTEAHGFFSALAKADLRC